MLPMQPGDVTRTFADTSRLEADYGFRPSVDLATGLAGFATWFAGWRSR
jgi:UDP-glucuronate 4-epimerase